jgi:hypothetical protein
VQTTSPVRYENLVSIEQEASWSPELVWTLCYSYKNKMYSTHIFQTFSSKFAYIHINKYIHDFLYLFTLDTNLNLIMAFTLQP